MRPPGDAFLGMEQQIGELRENRKSRAPDRAVILRSGIRRGASTQTFTFAMLDEIGRDDAVPHAPLAPISGSSDFGMIQEWTTAAKIHSASDGT